MVLDMERRRNLIPIVLAGLLLFSNTACACDGVAGDISDTNPHAHHQMSDTGSQPDNALCSHEDCDNCQSLDVAVTPDRDASLTSYTKLGVDDDVVWVESSLPRIHPPEILLASIGPPTQRQFLSAETPVLRADLLLE